MYTQLFLKNVIIQLIIDSKLTLLLSCLGIPLEDRLELKLIL